MAGSGRPAAWPAAPSLHACRAAELSERVEEAGVAATYPEAEDAHQGRVQQLAAAADEAKENVDQLNAELR